MGDHVNGPIRNLFVYGTAAAISLMSAGFVIITILGLFGVPFGD
jgi:hypothetical protein